MRVDNVQEAKTQLSRLLDAAHAGQTILLAKAGKPGPAHAPGGGGRLAPERGAAGADAPPASGGASRTPAAHVLLWWLSVPERLSPAVAAAQAELEQLALVTVDPALAGFPCRLCW